MRTLLVLRHAKSSWDDSSLDDHERPLNSRGRRDAPRMGELLRAERLVPDLIVSSDAVRAHSTAAAAAEAAGYRGQVVLEPDLYHAEPARMVEVLRQLDAATARRVLIVGHNPGLEQLVEALSGEAHDLPTAALVQLALPIDDWSELSLSTRAAVVNLWRPRELAR